MSATAGTSTATTVTEAAACMASVTPAATSAGTAI